MPSTPRVVALVRGADSRLAIEAAVGLGNALVLCGTLDDFVLLAAAAPCVVLWELVAADEVDLGRVARRLSALNTVRGVIVRLDLTRAAARQVLAVAKALPCARLSIRGHDDLAADLAHDFDEAQLAQPEMLLARHVLPHVPKEASNLIAAAAVASKRRLEVTRFATLCQVPVRTLEWMLQRSSVAPAWRVLGYFLAVHSVWRLDVLGWPAKRVAVTAGFASRQAWAGYLLRHVGATPTRLIRAGGFAWLLAQWRARLLNPSTALDRSANRSR